MNNKRLRALLALNGALLVVLGLVTFAPGSAQAQSRSKRAHGQYAVVAGRIQGRTESAIFVVDGSNEELIALHWDSSRRRYNAVGFRDIRSDSRRRGKEGR